MRSGIVGIVIGFSTMLAAQPSWSQDTDRPAVEMVTYSFEHYPKDIPGGVFKDLIAFTPEFKNNTDKVLVGLVVDFTLTDAFGEEVRIPGKRIDMRVGPNETAAPLQGMGWENNPFDSDEPYDRFYGPVTNGTLKATAEIKRAVYSDGTSN